MRKGVTITEKDKQRLVNEAVGKDGTLPENMKCLICFHLVYQPLMCTKCGNALYCKMCIDTRQNIKCACG